jgi:hypothetical protein
MFFNTPEERDSAEKLTKGWHGRVCQTAAGCGWHLDNLGSLTQVLRVPGMWNYKTPDKPAQVVINFFDASIRYKESQIRSFISDTSLSPNESYCLDSVVLNTAAQPPESKFIEAMTASAKFRNTWELNRPDLSDQSQSGYDMSLATIAALLSWTDQEIADLIIAARRKHNDKPYKALRPDYIGRTISNARMATAQNDADSDLTPAVDLSAITNSDKNTSVPEYKPFPAHVLPDPICSYVMAASESLGCDPAYVALPVLSVFASCIGNSARVLLKRDWKEPCVLWTAVIGESGTMKSPAFKLGVNIIKQIQYKALKLYQNDLDAYAKSLEEYDIAIAHSKRSNTHSI